MYGIDGAPPKVIFTILINKSIKVTCYNYSKVTPVSSISTRFSAKLEQFSHLRNIVQYMKRLAPDELLSGCKFLSKVNKVLIKSASNDY